jgi:hypothetical protein
MTRFNDWTWATLVLGWYTAGMVAFAAACVVAVVAGR